MKAVNVTIVSILFQAGIYATWSHQGWTGLFHNFLSRPEQKNKEERGKKVREEGERKVGRDVSNFEGRDQMSPLFSGGFPKVPFQDLGFVSE